MSFLEHELTAHSTALRALARVLVGEPNADDLVQDTTLQVLRAPPPELLGLRGWLTAVLRHRASKHHRGESRRRARSRWLTGPEPAATPERLLERKETIERLHLALTSLPEPYQSTLLLRFFEDLTPTAIAAQTGTPLATVKSRLQRGIGLLRDRMPGAGDRRDWRPALVATFGLDGTQLAGRGLGAVSAGVLLMTTKLPLLAGATVLLLAICLFKWDRGGQPPTRGNEPAARAGDALAGALAIAPDASSAPASERIPVAGNVPPPPFRARVVDAFDRAPLPFYAVQIVDPEVPDAELLVTSDANGELSLDGTLRGRAVAIQAVDDPEHALSNRQVIDVAAHGWPAAAQVLELPFQTGPTYTLLFETPPPEGDLVVSLLAGKEPRLDWRGDAFVRRGPLPWVRFDAHSTNASVLGEGPWTLTVLDDSGLWVAWGAVQTARGMQQQPVVMRCDRRGAIAVHASQGGRDLAGDFHASVYRLGADGKPFGRDTTVHGTHSRVRIPFLEPGRYAVYVGRLDDTSYREHVTVQAGEVTEVRAEFAEREARPPLRVIARSQTGRRDLSALSLFFARRPDGSGLRYSKFGPPLAAEPLATKPLEITYEAHFADLPPGEWIVALEPTRRLPPWNHTEQRVRADSGIVEFTCLDEGAPPEVSIAVRVVRAGTGAPIAYAGVTTYADHEAWMLLTTGADGAVSIGTCLAGQPIQLLVRAAGCQPEWIETTAPSPDNAEPVRVAMQPGWGTLLQVVEPGPEVRGAVLPNVQVLLDGVLAGTTDERGRMLLRSGTRPRRIDLRRDGYTVQYGSIDAATGAPESQEQSPFFVVMRRKQ